MASRRLLVLAGVLGASLVLAAVVVVVDPPQRPTSEFPFRDRAPSGQPPTPPVDPPPPGLAGRVRLELVTRDAVAPVLLVAAPGDRPGRAFVVEKGGRVRALEDGRLAAEPLLDVGARISKGSEQGLLGLAFHPRFAEDRRLFVNLTDPRGTTRVLEFRVPSGEPLRVDPASEREVLQVPQPYANHNGGHVVFGPDGWLWVGMGDGGAAGDPKGSGQDPAALLGKLLRVRVDPPNAPPEVVIHHLGLRNPWRFSFDRATGDLYVGDVGQNLWEEVDVVPRDAGPRNFGWNRMEGAHCFGAPTCDAAAFVAPAVEYGHDVGCSITGGFVYRGRAVPELAGHYFYADYCTGVLRSFRWEGGVVRDAWDWTATLAPNGALAQTTSFGEDADGELYVLTQTGAVRRFAAAR